MTEKDCRFEKVVDQWELSLGERGPQSTLLLTCVGTQGSLRYQPGGSVGADPKPDFPCIAIKERA